MDPPTKQQAYKTLVNEGIIRPTNKAPSPVDNIVVVEYVTNEDDVEIATSKADVKVKECKMEKTDPETPKSELDRISAGSNGGLFFNNDGQQQSARVWQFQDGCIHLQHQGHLYYRNQS